MLLEASRIMTSLKLLTSPLSLIATGLRGPRTLGFTLGVPITDHLGLAILALCCLLLRPTTQAYYSLPKTSTQCSMGTHPPPRGLVSSLPRAPGTWGRVGDVSPRSQNGGNSGGRARETFPFPEGTFPHAPKKMALLIVYDLYSYKIYTEHSCSA